MLKARKISNECQFCPALRGSFQAQIIVETPRSIAIHPRRPLSLGHTIIFPKVHRKGILDLSDREVATLFRLIKKIAQSLTRVYRTESYNLFANIGKEAGQSIPHLHFHIVPRFGDESVNPFKILNNRKLYKALEAVTPQQMAINIKKISRDFKSNKR